MSAGVDNFSEGTRCVCVWGGGRRSSRVYYMHHASLSLRLQCYWRDVQASAMDFHILVEVKVHVRNTSMTLLTIPVEMTPHLSHVALARLHMYMHAEMEY